MQQKLHNYGYGGGGHIAVSPIFFSTELALMQKKQKTNNNTKVVDRKFLAVETQGWEAMSDGLNTDSKGGRKGRLKPASEVHITGAGGSESFW